MNGKTKIYFGPPLSKLTEGDKNTLEISGKINRAAERYMAILERNQLVLTDSEKACIRSISMIGFMSIEEIEELPNEVEWFDEEIEGLDKKALADKLKSASYASLVAMVESLSC